MKRSALLILFILTLFLYSCSDNLVYPEDFEISLSNAEQEITIQNNLDEPVYYFAVEAGLAARINWAPGIQEDNKIEEGSSVQVAYADIAVTYENRDIIVYYWTAEKTNDGNFDIRIKVTKATF